MSVIFIAGGRAGLVLFYLIDRSHIVTAFFVKNVNDGHSLSETEIHNFLEVQTSSLHPSQKKDSLKSNPPIIL